jgi:hypothetical protein
MGLLSIFHVSKNERIKYNYYSISLSNWTQEKTGKGMWGNIEYDAPNIESKLKPAPQKKTEDASAIE